MIRLLIVDDDIWVLKGIRKIVDWEALGFEIVDEATNGDTALDKIMANPPDIVLTDIVMPGMTGLQLLKSISSSGLKTEFIILTGFAEFSYAKEACRLGAFDYLLKPLEKNELLDVVERFKQKYNIMHNCDEEDPRLPPLPYDSSNATLSMILGYIKQNFSASLRLYEVAEHFHFNFSYISQLFTKELGITFSEYVIRYRLDMAEKLLYDSTLPVKDVCRKVGINDYFYFNKLYKKYKGATPTSIRKQGRAVSIRQ